LAVGRATPKRNATADSVIVAPGGSDWSMMRDLRVSKIAEGIGTAVRDIA
jgi:hypothetical protein